MGRIVAGGMLRENTPLEDYRKRYGLWVKREDKSCTFPGPYFSKARGVFARLANRPEKLIGVLDTYHSQAGHAVARACSILGKTCWNFYPEYKNDPGYRKPQEEAKKFGAKLVGLPAGRSCILFHAARKQVETIGGYMMPNALKLQESVTETAKEVPNRRFDHVIIPASSATIAAGVVQGFWKRLGPNNMPRFIVHLGYSRSHEQVEAYVCDKSQVYDAAAEDLDIIDLEIIDEGYGYKDQAADGKTPPWPCNVYYELKAFPALPCVPVTELMFYSVGPTLRT